MYDSKTEQSTKQSKLPLIISGIIITAIMVSYFTIPEVKIFSQETYNVLTSGNEKRISEWVDQLGFWGPFFIIAGMSLQMFLLIIPSPLLIVVSVVAFGSYWGSLIAVSAIFIASTIGFFIGKLLGKVTVERLIGHKKRKKIEFYVERYSGWAVFITRLAPLLSNDAISFVAGILRMSYWKFIAATLSGIIPLTVLIAYFGENNERLKNGLIWISAVSLVIFIIYVIYDRKKNPIKKNSANHKK